MTCSPSAPRFAATLTWIAGRIAGTGMSAGLTAAGTLGLWPFTMFFAGLTVLAGGVVG